MSEARLLSLVVRYPHPTALARRVRDRTLFDGLRRLEAEGLVRKRRGLYRLTRQGRRELATTTLLVGLLARS
jgi:DNA-binding PadR family transcriptional regulator